MLQSLGGLDGLDTAMDQLMGFAGLLLPIGILLVGARFFLGGEGGETGAKIVMWIFGIPLGLVLLPVAIAVAPFVGVWWLATRRQRRTKRLLQAEPSLARRSEFDAWLHEKLLWAQIDRAAGRDVKAQIDALDTAKLANAQQTLQLQEAIGDSRVAIEELDHLAAVEKEWGALKAFVR